MQSPCVEWLLSDFCKMLDESELPIVENVTKVGFTEELQNSENATWNLLNKQLLSTTTNIRDNEQAVQFLKKWLLRSSDPTSHISDAPLGKYIAPGIAIKDVQAGLQKRETHSRDTFLEYSSAMNVRLRHKLKGIESPTLATLRLNPFDPPLTLIRIWDDNSHSPYTKSLGFRCGNWRKCQPADDFIELTNKGLLNPQKISNHCQDEGSASDWISFSDNALWILSKCSDRFSSTQRDCRIAIINVASLDRLGIPWQRSDFLVQQLGGKLFSPKNKDGVQFAWPGHYLVYGWVPPQCIVRSFTLEEFQTLCQQRNIVKGKSLIFFIRWLFNKILKIELLC